MYCHCCYKLSEDVSQTVISKKLALYIMLTLSGTNLSVNIHKFCFFILWNTFCHWKKFLTGNKINLCNICPPNRTTKYGKTRTNVTLAWQLCNCVTWQQSAQYKKLLKVQGFAFPAKFSSKKKTKNKETKVDSNDFFSAVSQIWHTSRPCLNTDYEHTK